MNGSEDQFCLTRVASSGRARNQIPTSRELERLRSRVEQVRAVEAPAVGVEEPAREARIADKIRRRWRGSADRKE